MKLILKIGVIWLLWSISMNISLAQTIPLKLGDKLPKLKITNLYNTSLKSIHTEDLTGKIVLIDFWSTWCKGCIIGLMRMDSLQKQFGDKILILPVTYEPKEIVDKFWKKNAITKRLKLFSVTNDTVLQKLFPHTGVPSEFWLDKSGRFLSATDIEYVNEKEFTSLIEGSKPNWVAFTTKKPHDFSKKMLAPTTNLENMDCFYSAFFNYSANEKSEFNILIDSVKKTIRITFVNFNIAGLYYHSLSDLPLLRSKKRTFYNIKNKARVKYDKQYGYKTAWDYNNTYSYELFWSLGDSLNVSAAFKKMRIDLDSFLGLKSEIKEVESDYYALIKKDSMNRARDRGDLSDRIALSNLIEIWNGNESLPIITTRLNNPGTVYFDAKLAQSSDINSINYLLKSEGYELKKEIGKLPFFYLIDDY